MALVFQRCRVIGGMLKRDMLLMELLVKSVIKIYQIVPFLLERGQ